MKKTVLLLIFNDTPVEEELGKYMYVSRNFYDMALVIKIKSKKKIILIIMLAILLFNIDYEFIKKK